MTAASEALSPNLPTAHQHAAARFKPALISTLVSLLSTLAILRSSSLPTWWFLPFFVLHLELIARLYDQRVLGRVNKKPSPKAMFDSPIQTFTWQEVADHATEESAWIAIDGLVYDVTAFVDSHPGGREMLLLSVGRDATDLFNSYHPFTSKPRAVLKKYRIGSLATFEHPVYKPDTGFYKDCCTAVQQYFQSTGEDDKDPKAMFLRMAPVYVVFIMAYLTAVFVPNVSLPVRVIAAIVLGVCQGMPLTGWMHDASHAAIGHSERWWWNVGRFALDYMSGSSLLSWRNQHVLGHHVYTNVMGADPDLPVCLEADPRRLVKQQRQKDMYQWQHVYLPPLYGILGMKSRVQDITEIYSQLTNGPIRVNPIVTEDYLRLISSKSVWFFYRVVVPWVFFKAVSPGTFALLFFCTEMMTGYWLAFNFQVSHISDDVDYLFSDTSKRANGECPAMIEEEWAKTQIQTTVDYGHGDPVAAYMSGALNYQTVHHLFPTVSQAHYPKITPIVMKVAEKHGIKFNVFKSFPSALMAHVRHLRNMGLEGRAAELKME